MPCAICGNPRTEDAHVKAKCSFEEGQDDITWNIVPLCPTCHTEFDDSRVGVSQDKKFFSILSDDGTVLRGPAVVGLDHLKDEYVMWRNERCVLRVRLMLGLVRGYEHYAQP